MIAIKRKMTLINKNKIIQAQAARGFWIALGPDLWNDHLPTMDRLKDAV